MGNPKKRPIISPRKTAFLLIFSMLLSVFTVFPSFAEGSGGEEVIPALPDTALSDVSLAEPSVNIETETIQTETAVASAVNSTPVKVETANTTISTQYGVDMEKDETQNIHVFTGSSVQSITARSNKSAVVSCQTPENIATGFYAVPIQAKQVGIATITVDVTYNGGATETVSIEIYVVMEDGVYAIKSKANHLPTNLGDYYLRVETPSSSVSNIIASTNTYGEVPNNIYRYWKIEYAGNGEYYIRCLAQPTNLLSVANNSAVLSSGSGEAQRWVIRYNYGAYELATCSPSDYSNGILLITTNVHEGLYNSSFPYYYAEPTINPLLGAQFELWDFEPIDISGIYFRKTSTGIVSASFSYSLAVLVGETFDLDDLGYALVMFGEPSTATANWVSSSPSIVSVDAATGTMTAVSAGTTTITVYVNEYQLYASFTVTVVIKPLADGIYFLRNLGTRLYATIQSGTMSDGHGIGQHTFQGSNIQKWKFVYQSGGNIYTIQSAQNETYYLGTANNASAVGTNIVLRTGTVTSGMKWRILRGNKGWKICAFSDTSMVLATNSSGATAGQNLILGDWVDNDSYRDEWGILIEDYQSIFVDYRVPSKTFTLQCKGTLAKGSTWYPLIQDSVAAWNSTVSSNITVSSSLSSVYTCEVDSYAEDWLGLTTSHCDSYGKTIDAIVKINARTCSSDSNSRKSTIAHEIGHLFGLEDNPPVSSPSLSLMHYNRNRSVIYQPQPYDIENVKYIYNNW